MTETLEGWLLKEIKDAENVVEMYRSYRRYDAPPAGEARARLRALNDVAAKVQELWHVPVSPSVSNGERHGE